jgi:hypothetical protein
MEVVLRSVVCELGSSYVRCLPDIIELTVHDPSHNPCNKIELYSLIISKLLTVTLAIDEVHE